ncbi:HIT-like domain-containing protein [Kalaharituber pfeilii]|nr:HIT-like domain-containing protein [Kalaharituber pfeilii]
MSTSAPVYFGPFVVTSQVFYRSKHSFALINHKPLLPGHVLVCPNRVVPRLKDLDASEVIDLFLSVQKVGKIIEKVFQGESLNIAIQDGKFAGQSVPHVHTHIIPRRHKDLKHSDDIYALIESDAGDLGKIFREQGQSIPSVVSTQLNKELVVEHNSGSMLVTVDDPQDSTEDRPKFPMPLPDELRQPRTVKEMEKEAKLLAKFMEETD